jgi:ditrans,polycis-polyprenyl diphosphate synthase
MRYPISSLPIRALASKVIREGNVPSHVALIMDGNRRFARQRNLKRIEGHSMGFEKLKEVGKSQLCNGERRIEYYEKPLFYQVSV